MKLKTDALLIAGAGLAVWYLYGRAKAVGAAINPVSDQNVFYQGGNAVVDYLSGDSHATVGTWLYDLFH